MFRSSSSGKLSRKRSQSRDHNNQKLPSIVDNDDQDADFVEEHKHQQVGEDGHLQVRTTAIEEEQALIYAAPTVDTLGTDEGSLLRLYRQQPRLQRLDDDARHGPVSFISKSASNERSSAVTASNILKVPPQPTIPKRRRPRPNSIKADREFQHPEDVMTVTALPIPVAERSAFDKKMPPYKGNKKTSPSFQHWQILQRLNSVTHVRQLAFSPSVGPAADIFWDEEADEQEEEERAVDSPRSRRPKRDGRYRSINPVTATMAGLPKTPPLLSNKKHRLPMRSDVGFPNATPEEIERKQREIQQETEWEEASPRLIVLVTSDDLGTAVQEDHEMENGQGLPGMPWAGKELIRAKDRNHRHFSKRRENQHNGSKPKSGNQYVKRTNMLAPPLDAISSKTLGWRPRPFHDRPPGMTYTLVCPLAVDFAIGKMEPLICSLALYSLKSGKASEEFYFPAGDWRGKFQLDSLRKITDNDKQHDLLVNEVWQHRKHKAIFAHNTAVMGVEESDLYIVLQVCKMAHVDPATAYWAKGSGNEFTATSSSTISTDRKTWRKKLKKHFQKDGKEKSSSRVGGADESDIEKAHLRSNAVFEAYGTQLTTLLCFGIAPLYPEGTDSTTRSNIWPKGQVQQGMNLYAAPAVSESQEEFLDRLRVMVGYPLDNTTKSRYLAEEGSTSFGIEDSSVASDSISDFASPKKGSMRRFISPRKSSKKITGQTQHIPVAPMESPMIPGSVTLFSSCLEIDFLQSMLSTPPELIDKVSLKSPREKSAREGAVQSEELALPRIFVDASADSAIMIDPAKTVLSPSPGFDSARRSDLVRLPSAAPAEHLDSSEFREVLFLPSRPDRNYECDYLQADHKSLLNLLYLHPRRLVYRPKDSVKTKLCVDHLYTVRIRLIQNLSTTNANGIIESSNRVLDSFHNPAPWGGSNLLSSVFTRIPGNGHQSRDDAQNGIPLRDEYKMKLPDTLDASYFLQFTLYTVDLSDCLEDLASGNVHEMSSRCSSDEECGLALQPIGETTIPLCSKSIRDAKSGAKATTVIPNGCHRLRLGDFQFQIETRLISAIHVSDPAIAAALRDFPSLGDLPTSSHSYTDKYEELVLVTNRSVVSRPLSAASGDSCADSRVSFSSLFANASGSSIAAHFQSLIMLHLSNLVSSKVKSDDNVTERFLRENLLSLTVLFRRMKEHFSSAGISSDGFGFLIKITIDAFDEGILHGATAAHITDEESEPRYMDTEEPDFPDDNDFPNDEPTDGGAIRRRKRQSVSSNIDLRISRTFSPTDTAGIPFSRKVFGASKTDRMKMEAELGIEAGHFTTLFDDDETVMTLATTTRYAEARKAEAQLCEARKTLEMNHSMSPRRPEAPENPSPSANSIAQATDQSHGLDFQRSISELALGQRMKSAAQVMLAPCVTPGLSAVFLCKTSPRASSSMDNSDKAIKLRSSEVSAMLSPPVTKEARQAITSSGSDLDDNETRSQNKDLYLHTPYGFFRGPWDGKTVKFTGLSSLSNQNYRISKCMYAYESIMIIWLQAWMDRATGMDGGSVKDFFRESSGQEDDENPYAVICSQTEALLPLILKSISMRYASLAKKSNSTIVRLTLDETHANMFVSFAEMLAIGLMGQATDEPKGIGKEFTLEAAINRCDYIADFFTGLFAILHPAHLEALVHTFIKTLRSCEAVSGSPNNHEFFEWNEISLHRAKCSRQLRLRTIEKLAVINSFVAVNFPPRFTDDVQSIKSRTSSWTRQYVVDSLSSEHPLTNEANLILDDGLLPKVGWLSSLLTNESLSICALSCEAVVAEAMAHIESQGVATKSDAERSALQHRPTASLNRDDLLMFQSIAIHAITTVHELLLRRHAMDRRFQKDSSRGRMAALFLQPIFDKSLAGVRWMARMESTHKVRSIWLLCFVYVLQEAPESLVREAIRTYSNPRDGRIHRFIRLLRLSSSTFQSFIDQERHCMFPLEIDKEVSPWLLQESFNTVCATTILVVEESVAPTSYVPNEQRKMIQGILDLLLHVLTTPQSSVTHLRAVGGAIQALQKFGVQMFLEITGVHLQHWLRVVLGLMNSTALSVRSIAVDFVISLLGGLFELAGNVDDVTLVFATVLPEVAAREIALCSVSGLIGSHEDAEKSLWPLRRSFADIEDANPLDDDRVDPQLSPILSIFCRASQAIVDGVLIEMRLRKNDCVVVGTKLRPQQRKNAFDADEESLFEAANFFSPETAPMQRVRWLMSLKALHEEKGQWVEAAESLIAASLTIARVLPHIKHVWRPSRFPLWYDARRSLWLSTVGQELGNPEKGNAQVMAFAGDFLEPEYLAPSQEISTATSMLPQLGFDFMCVLLTKLSKESASMFSKESCVEVHAYLRIENVLKVLMNTLDKHERSASKSLNAIRTIMHRKNLAKEISSLRKVTASLTSDLTAIAEKLSQCEQFPRQGNATSQYPSLYFVRLRLSGKKPKRFQESTTLPTFLEWDKDCICRVPKAVVDTVLKTTHPNSDRLEVAMCTAFSKLVRDALLQDLDSDLLMFHVGSNYRSQAKDDNSNSLGVTNVEVGFVHSIDSKVGPDQVGEISRDVILQQSRRFKYQLDSPEERSGKKTVEVTVATAFPSPLSRQRSLLTSEYFVSGP